MQKNTTNNFEKFTNQYSLSKTLRFSLIPMLTEEQENEILKEKRYKNVEEIKRQDKIEKFFRDNKSDLFDVDVERSKRYKVLKYYLTELHKLFIKESLNKAKNDPDLDFKNLFKEYKKYEVCKDEDEKINLVKSVNTEKEKIAKYFGDKEGKKGVFQKTAAIYYDWLKINLSEGEKIKDDKDKKQRKNNILLSSNVLLILNKKIEDGSVIEKKEDGFELKNIVYVKNNKQETGTIADYFSGWTTYFKNFNEIRGNLYKDNGRKETDEDSNTSQIKIQKANSGQITTRIIDENFEIFTRNNIWFEQNKKHLDIKDLDGKNLINGLDIFDPDFYRNCFLQSDINEYNKQISILNSYFNEYRQGKDKDVKYLKPLYKQLLLTDGLDDLYIQEFVDENSFLDGLYNFYSNSQEKNKIAEYFLKQDIISDNMTDIWLDENQLHYFCNKYFGSWSYLRTLYHRKYNVINKDWGDKKEEFKDSHGMLKTSFSLAEIKDLLETESKTDFVNSVGKGWFSFDYNTQKSDLIQLKNAGVFKEDVSNFENFISFLQFELKSLVFGRDILSKKESVDRNKISQTKESLIKKMEKGEYINDLILEKFSEENFMLNLLENVEKKAEKFQSAYEKIKEAYKNQKKLSRNQEFECNIAINEYCVRVNDINKFFRLFSVPEGVYSGVVNTVVHSFQEGNKINELFDIVRNYITKKQGESEKIKLNFEIKNLLGGWGYKTDEHPNSTDYKCRIYRKDAQIYLGIVGGKKSHLVNSSYELMDYYQLDGKGIFNVYRGTFKNKYKDDRAALYNSVLLDRVEKIIDDKLWVMFEDARSHLDIIKNNKSNGLYDFHISRNDIASRFIELTGLDYDKYKKKDKKDIILTILKDKYNLFDFESESEYLFERVKELFGKTPKRKDFLGVDKMVYQLVSLAPYFYKIGFVPASNNEDIKALFRIYNKDFSVHKKEGSLKNLHTLYFEELFSKLNQEKPIFKLSGGAEVFFREKIDDFKIEVWDRKNLKNPKTNVLPNRKRRFTENQILFHVPIVLNNISKGDDINTLVHRHIQEDSRTKILGIDRGEKELAYYCLLDADGKIFKGPSSLNVVGTNIVNGQKKSINYRDKLDIREKERMMARRSWTVIESIKDIKTGYISNIVQDIAQLMVDSNAFICLEELNHGFKKDRSIRIEKGVYQRLENALVDKLGHLVLEKTSEGVRKALQLTPENKALKYWGNQMGAIFYTDAKFTSKTCPNCGFRRRGVESMKTSKIIKDKIDNKQIQIFFEKEKDRFRIEYYWKVEALDFSCENLYGKGQKEVIYSDVERTFWNNNDLKRIFAKHLNLGEGIDLFSVIDTSESFNYTDFGKVFNSLIWLRHTVDVDGEIKDRISCPKCHFSTLSTKTLKIKDGDANGAYNIARRGLMIYKKVRNMKGKKIKSKDLKITLREWDEITYEQWDKKDWIISNNDRGL